MEIDLRKLIKELSADVLAYDDNLKIDDDFHDDDDDDDNDNENDDINGVEDDFYDDNDVENEMNDIDVDIVDEEAESEGQEANFHVAVETEDA